MPDTQLLPPPDAEAQPLLTGPEDPEPAPRRRFSRLALAALLLSVSPMLAQTFFPGANFTGCLSLVLVVAAFITSITAVRVLARNWQYWSGRWMAITGIPVSIVMFMMVLLQGQATTTGARNHCLGLQRELGVRIAQFQQDTGHFPNGWDEIASMQQWSARERQALTQGCWAHNWVDPRPVVNTNIGLNAELAGQPEPTKDLEWLILLADAHTTVIRGEADLDRYRHGNGFIVTFVDGVVRYCHSQDPVRLRLKPELPPSIQP